MSEALLEPLNQGAAALGLNLDGRQLQLLLEYMALIEKWNQVYNLTAVRDPQKMLTHHLLDCLSVLPSLDAQLKAIQLPAGAPFNLLDVGAGAGLPGAVIAICCPHISVTCIDAVAKKVGFVQQVVAALKLANLRALHARVESLTQPYALICSRAFASLADFTSGSLAALGAGGVWMAMKGKEPSDEINQLPAGVEVFHVEHLVVPGLDAERCLVWMRRSDET